MKETTFDYSKPFTTFDGRKAEFVCDMLMHGRAVKVIKLTHANGDNSIGYYDSYGCEAFNGKTNSDLDLVNVPEKKHLTMRFAIYASGVTCTSTRPCVIFEKEGLVAIFTRTIEYTVGEGVES